MNLFRRHAAVEGSPGSRRDARLPIDDLAFFAKWRVSAFCNSERVS